MDSGEFYWPSYTGGLQAPMPYSKAAAICARADWGVSRRVTAGFVASDRSRRSALFLEYREASLV